MRTLSLWSRRYFVRRAVVIAAVEVVLWRLLSDPLRIPGRGSDIEWVAAPLIPALLAMAAPDALQVAHQDNEIVTIRPVAHRRAAIAAVLVVLGITAALVGERSGAGRFVAARNALQLTGIGFWSALLLPRSIAWAPLLTLPVVVWLVGTPGPGDPVPGWALLLLDQHSMAAATFAVITVGSGALLYVARTRSFGRN